MLLKETQFDKRDHTPAILTADASDLGIGVEFPNSFDLEVNGKKAFFVVKDIEVENDELIAYWYAPAIENYVRAIVKIYND